MRGLRLHRERGAEVVLYLDSTVGIPSETEDGGLYIVDLKEESCDCPSYRFTSEPCKHVFVAILYRAKHRDRFPLPPAAPTRSGRRCVRSAA